jgi:hypothetical protein
MEKCRTQAPSGSVTVNLRLGSSAGIGELDSEVVCAVSVIWLLLARFGAARHMEMKPRAVISKSPTRPLAYDREPLLPQVKAIDRECLMRHYRSIELRP